VKETKHDCRIHIRIASPSQATIKSVFEMHAEENWNRETSAFESPSFLVLGILMPREENQAGIPSAGPSHNHRPEIMRRFIADIREESSLKIHFLNTTRNAE
jgi:hypothetical protein